MKRRLEKYVSMTGEALEKHLYPVTDGQGVLREAMRYSLTAGGKRIRPVLVLEFCRLCGAEPERALPFACALEMVHTYSLIHDDLPCMDDDDLRRGRPSCHKKFGEAIALLAGDALLTLAFETAAKAGEVSVESRCRAIERLANLAGMSGMVGGQVLDLLAETSKPDLRGLEALDRLKTGALIRAAALLGCFASDRYDRDRLRAASLYAEKLGSAFQITDDILDVTGDAETLGKPVGSDEKNQKVTYVGLMGLEQSRAAADRLTGEAIEALSAFAGDTDFLADFAQTLAARKK